MSFSSRLGITLIRSRRVFKGTCSHLRPFVIGANSPNVTTVEPSTHNFQTTAPNHYCNPSKNGLEILNIQDEKHFKKNVLDSDIPVIIDFHADWCGPCKLLAPRLEKAMENCGQPIRLAKVDVDLMGDLAIKYRVNAVPAVIAIKDGKSVDKFVGLQDEDEIDTFVAKLIG